MEIPISRVIQISRKFRVKPGYYISSRESRLRAKLIELKFETLIIIFPLTQIVYPVRISKQTLEEPKILWQNNFRRK